MSLTDNSKFSITAGQGFHMTFENRWTVSVQWGRGNYCGNRGAPRPIPGQEYWDSRTAEITCWYGDDDAEEVQGWMLADDVAEFIAEVAKR